MERNLSHSAEGSTWSKKNHKYIRKEGNRYIYPEDVQKGSRTKALNSQGSVNYKQLGQQRANREAAKNGVKELYRMDDGSYVREHGKSDREFAKVNGQYVVNQRRQKTGAGSPTQQAHNQEHAKRMTDLQATKRAYQESGGKSLTKYDVYPNGAYNADRKKTTIRVKPNAPGSDTPIERAKYVTNERRRRAAAGSTPRQNARYDDRGFRRPTNDTGYRSQEDAKNATLERRRQGHMSPRNVHRPGSSELHDDRGFKKDQSQYYDEKGVRKTSNPTHVTQYDDRGVRKKNSTLTYEEGDKPEPRKTFLEKYKEASDARKWDKEKKSIKKQNEKELEQRQKNAAKAAKEAEKAEKKRKREEEKQLRPDMRRKLQMKRGKKAVAKFLSQLNLD